MDIQKFKLSELSTESCLIINGGTEDPYSRGYENGHAAGAAIREAIGTLSVITFIVSLF